MLSHLAYISKRSPSCTDQEINEILISSDKNNNALGITGILLYDDRKFLQYVEGEYKNIIPLYDRIKQDNRHDHLAIVSLGIIEEKIFPSWNMANKKVDFGNIDYRTDISDEDKVAFDDILSGKEQKGTKILSILKLIA